MRHIGKDNTEYTPHMRACEGYIALMSVVVIVFILLSTTAALATTSFLNRFNILEGEAKETSAGLAAACVESARIKIARNGTGYTPDNDTLNVGSEECTIVRVTHASGESTIQARGAFKEATTNYEVVVDESENVTVISWREVPSF